MILDKIDKDEISLTKQYVTFGNGLKNFFIKMNITHLIVVIDFNQKAFFFFDGRGDGYTFEKTPNHNPSAVRILLPLKKFLGHDMNIRYKVRKFKGNCLYVKDVDLKKFLVMTQGGPQAKVSVEHRLIILGTNTERFLNLKPSDLIIQSSVEAITAQQAKDKLPKGVSDKEIDIFDDSNNARQNALPPEAIDKANKRYSKMILGE